MALKGDLASVDLAQVFQMLALNQKVGILSIQGPRAWKALYFGPRGTTLYYNEYALIDRVLLQMVRSGRLAEESVREAREHAGSQATTLLTTMLEGGYVSEGDLLNAMRLEIEEEIYDLFFWRDAHFEFYEGANSVEGREGVVDERFFLSTDSLIMEAARRIDEWAYIQEKVPGPLEVYRAVDIGSDEVELDGYCTALFDLADGKRNVSRLTEITGIPAFQVYKGLAVLLDEHLLEDVPEQELIVLARECAEALRLQDAINLYEKAIASGVGIPDSHAEVAELYEKAQEFELAAYHHKCVAEYHAAADHKKEAVAILRRVIELLPTDLGARERLVELTVGKSSLASTDFDPVASGKELVDLYLEIGEIERVRGILERLLRDNPEDLELKKSLVNVHTKAGDTKRVIELYLSIADDMVHRRNPIEAVKYLQKVLMLDRTRRDIGERIRSLYQMDERRRSRRRSLLALGLMLVMMAALSVGYFFYDRFAGEKLQKLEGTVNEMVARNEFQAAIGQLRDFTRKFPLTMVSRRAEAEITHIESLEERHEADLENERRRVADKLRLKRQRYKERHAEFQQLVKGRRLDEALVILDEVIAMVAEAGAEEDTSWARDMRLDYHRVSLRKVMGDALALDREAWKKFEAGNWQEARTDWLKLVDEFELTTTAHDARLPCVVDSRPSGAAIYRDGEPLVDGEGKQVVTPAVLLCRHREPEQLELRMEGFEPREFAFDAIASEVHSEVLTARPLKRLEFPSPGQSQPGAQHGYLGVGVRGGRVAVTGVETGETRAVIQLPELDEIAGAPQFTIDRVFFATKTNRLMSCSLPDGKVRWDVQLKHPPMFEPRIVNGRVFIADDQGRLIALDANAARELWTVPLNGLVGGSPEADRGFVRVGLRAGRVVSFDVGSGEIFRSHEIGVGVSTSTYGMDGVVAFGTEDGTLRAIDERSGRPVWQIPLERSVDDTELLRVGPDLYAMNGNSQILRVRSGKVIATRDLPGRRISGPVVAGGRIFCGVRIDADKLSGKTEEYDLLIAMSADDLKVLWDYRDGGRFASNVFTDGQSPFLLDRDGAVLRFK